MRWQGHEGSNNVEDRRGQRPGPGGGLPIRGPIGFVMIIVVLVAGYYGVDLTPLLSGGGDSSLTSQSSPYTPTKEDGELAQFTSVALKMTEDVWTDIFTKIGRNYAPPKLVLYSDVTTTGCGYGEAAMGPFYCPEDRTVYIDLSFYQDMKRRLGGGGDFALGYVLAHEVGHHIQNLLGISQKMEEAKRGASKAEANQLSVKLELQADCFAGVWGNVMQNAGVLEVGDVEEALKTAEAIGDDRLQRESSGRVVPDSFTHGTSKQRYTWFKRGFDTGDPAACDTFKEIR